MWEEEPKWQKATGRALVFVVAFAFVFSLGVSLRTGHWDAFRTVVMWIGIFAAAICLYAALVWTLAHLVAMLWKIFEKFGHKHSGNLRH
jgi:cytochrome c biogenesis protein CcdA